MSYLFSYCNKLTSLDLSGWDTSKVTTMSHMFIYCSEITSLDLSNWDFSNVFDLRYMFAYCPKLTEIKMNSQLKSNIYLNNIFDGITTEGTFYYNPQYDYSKIIAKLPSTWTAVPLE